MKYNGSPLCPNCGKFCWVVYEWRGPSYGEHPACGSCGYNMVNHPRLAEQKGFDLEYYKETGEVRYND